MCSIILRISETSTLIGANRDEMLARPWQPPAAHWHDQPGIIAGRDTLAGGTWLGINAQGVMAAILNREGTLGPAPGKRSRGELPLTALTAPTAAAALTKFTTLDCALYRSFNLVIADAENAYLLRGLESGTPQITPLTPGLWMITSGEPNDIVRPRIARHLPKFRAAPATDWPSLLADNTNPAASAINIPPDATGFGTVCSSLITLTKTAPPRLALRSRPARPNKIPARIHIMRSGVIKAAGIFNRFANNPK